MICELFELKFGTILIYLIKSFLTSTHYIIENKLFCFSSPYN